MNKARTVSSVLMILVGLALLATPARSAVEVGTTVTIPDPCDDFSTVLVGSFDPCETPSTRPEITTTTAATTTTADVTTTTGDVTTTTEDDGPTTTTMVTTSTSVAPSTSAPGGVGGSGAGRPPTATQGGALARTGSSTAPLTAAGVALAGLGVVLLVAERRRAAGNI